MKKELMNIGLPKWPALAVKGKKISKDQAAEVIIRTDGSLRYVCTNDKEWIRELCLALDIPYADRWPHVNYEKLRSVSQGLGCLDLEFLENDRIASSYIFGPHGWCDWDGNIFCNSSNVGKWPSVGDIYQDWVKIAEAFPFLDLSSQIFSEEYCDEGSTALVEFRVKDGKVRVSRPKRSMKLSGFDLELEKHSIIGFNERGCSIEQFKSAIDMVRTKIKSMEN